MTQYSSAFKNRMVQRLIGPSAMSANALAHEVGVGQTVLSRWLRESRNVGLMSPSPNKKKRWTGAEKLRVLSAARGLGEHELGALLRREGLHATDLVAWQTAAEAALNEGGRPSPSTETTRIRELERELRRKDAALAETAALLVLKKKVQSIWGDADDSTDPRRER